MAKSGTNGSGKDQFGRIRPENGIPGLAGATGPKPTKTGKKKEKYPLLEKRGEKLSPEMAKSGTNGSGKGQFGRIRPENGIAGPAGAIWTGFGP